VNFGEIFLWELLGTAALTLMGCGVVANVVLKRTLGSGGGWLLVNFGWGFAVFTGATLAAPSGGHINPAVTLGLLASGKSSFGWAMAPAYLLGQMIGAFIGAVLCWATYKLQFDTHDEPSKTLGIFSTGPTVRNHAWNLVTEIIGTFVLLFWILRTGAPNVGLGYAAVAFVVIGIGNSLGGPTGYAINPARDLGPRLAYAVLPIKGKGDPNWNYSWVPVLGPIVGGVLAGLVNQILPGT
jgi:glycerol uptake facilitator protein